MAPLQMVVNANKSIQRFARKDLSIANLQQCVSGLLRGVTKDQFNVDQFSKQDFLHNLRLK